MWHRPVVEQARKETHCCFRLLCIIWFFFFFLTTALFSRRASLVAQTVKRLPAMRETWIRFLGREDILEKDMAIHSSTLAWKIPWMEEPDRLQSMGSQSRTWLSDFTFFHLYFHIIFKLALNIRHFRNWVTITLMLKLKPRQSLGLLILKPFRIPIQHIAQIHLNKRQEFWVPVLDLP